jgi:hypothetical protein
MDSTLYQSGLSLEEAFFRKRDAELIEQHRKIERIKRTREALSEISGIHNPKVLDRLIELEISFEVLASIAVVPLVEIAWADGHVDEREHKAVLEAAAGTGIRKGSVDYNLLDVWLKHRPPAKLLDAWVHYIEGLCETMSPQERNALRLELIGRARKVAEAAGGILGLAFNISLEEHAVLKKMESAFSKHISSRK